MLRSTLVACLASLGLCATPASAAASEQPPRLLVLIVVDQLGSDLLDRHAPHLTGGFRRLLNDGRRFPGAVVDHAPTNSLPGHLTAASGAHPGRHGIVDNSWIEIGEEGPRRVLGFSDPKCSPVTNDGPEAGREGLGPGRFESPTIVEWVQRANPEAKFVSVGTGGGVSVLHAGRARGSVLWFSPTHSSYVSSSCYTDALPEWAARFNEHLVGDFMQQDWTLSAPKAMLRGLRADAAAFENRGRDTAFPHRRPEESGQLPRWFVDTPFADQATLALAAAGLEAEKLGTDEITDVLTIGLSTLDHVGHAFGPYSVEQADTLHRMDSALRDFFELLDRKIGKGKWALAVTADHGAPPAPEDGARFGIEGARRVSESQAKATIDSIVAAAEQFENSEDRARAAQERAERVNFVARAIRLSNGRSSSAVDEIARLYGNSHRPGRVSLHPLYENEGGRSAAEFGIIIVPDPYVVIDWATSIHGSPYRYDREVALIFMGHGVEPGIAAAGARTVDVAPTLAALAGIAAIGEIDGRVLPLTASD